MRSGLRSGTSSLCCGSALAGIVLSFAATAQAADINSPVFTKAPAAAVASWTGFYAGLGLGSRTTADDLTTTSLLLDNIPQDLSDLAVTQPSSRTGFRANPYIGYNWQVAPRWVIGIEGDVGFGDQTTKLQGFFSGPAFGSSRDPADSLAVKTTWDASLRGRVGYLFTPSTLAYVTGGAAWQHDQVTSSCNCFFFGTPAVVTNSITRSGWTVGGGLETVLWGNWLARAEYRYADYGTGPTTIGRSSPNVLTSETFDTRLRSHLATFGLAYKFGEPVPGAVGPVEAFAAKAAVNSWGGLYAGLGIGAHATRTDVTHASESLAGVAQDLTGVANSLPFDGIGFRLNPYAGYNWQVAPRWVVGIEADAGFADHKTTRGGDLFAQDSSGEPGDSIAVKATWDASLRGRVGYLVTPATLLYATGGVAWQHFQLNSNCVSGQCVEGEAAPAVINQSATRVGGTVGGGIETALGGHWLARAEYRYADYGRSSFTVARAFIFPDLNPTVDVFDVAMRTHTVNFGLAYKFE